MSNTPKKPEDKSTLNPLTQSTEREEERHAEMLAVHEKMVGVHEKMIDVQEKIVHATKTISLATKWYAFAAMAMLLWSVIAFFLVQIYF